MMMIMMMNVMIVIIMLKNICKSNKLTITEKIGILQTDVASSPAT